MWSSPQRTQAVILKGPTGCGKSRFVEYMAYKLGKPLITVACKEGAKYRFCWLVRFTHKSVIDSYRDHPDHVAFADNLFRLYVGDGISIDYQDSSGERTAAGHLRSAAEDQSDFQAELL